MNPKTEIPKVSNGVRELRAATGLTQEDLAGKVGVSRVTINCLERGVYLPSIELALKLAKFFKRPVESIFVLEEPR
ncbi:MAG: helix-turn-helix transcriptional regulator [Elusimicrobia bacterium]|nr:helix-turn-helix transcriptional regulator [Elusimicrobiota bacterium]